MILEKTEVMWVGQQVRGEGNQAKGRVYVPWRKGYRRWAFGGRGCRIQAGVCAR